MNINPSIAGTVRAGRAIVRVGTWGSLFSITGWQACEVVNNNQSSADTFHISFSTSALPANNNAAWFSNQQDLYVEIYMGTPADPRNFSVSDLTKFILGQVDHVEYDPVNGLLDLTGRDLTRVFIDTKSTVKYRDQKASDIATKLALLHGLTPQVTPTKTNAGKYYENEHVHMTDERSEWDLLLYLAQQEGFAVYVRGETLYFGPRPGEAIDPAVTAPYGITWTPPSAQNASASSNVMSLTLTRALTVSRGINVTVRSWNSKLGKMFTASYPGPGKSIKVGKSTPMGGAQTYIRSFPNLTQQEAVAKAEALYHQIVEHEMHLTAELPGDTLLDTTTMIQLSGTGTAFDQVYYPDAITRRMEWDGGFFMSVTAKNMAPESQVQL